MKLLTEREANWETHDQELFAIIESLKQWQFLLEGTKDPVTCYTDHENLEKWKDANSWKNRRHARWHQFLASFNFTINFRPGKLSGKPDALSRRYNHTEIPNRAQTMIAVEKFRGFKGEVKIDIISEIKEAQQEDENIAPLIQSTKEKDSLPPTVQKGFKHFTRKKDCFGTTDASMSLTTKISD